MNELISLEETRFNESITVNPQGSLFLGYLYSVLVIAGVLPGGEDWKIGMPDLQVRITVDGTPRIDFPSDVKTIRGTSKRVARYFTASAASREFLTNAVFALPAVSRAVERAERLRAAA